MKERTIKALCLAIVLFCQGLFASCREPTAYSDKTMVCLGDSITSGYMIDRAYPEAVGKRLGMKKVYNHGIAGSTLTTTGGVYPFVDRFAEMEDADIVAVLFAGNDATYHVPLGEPDDTGTETVFGALNTLILGLKAKYPSAYLFFITPLMNGNKEAIRPYVEATREACRRHQVDLLWQFDEGVPYDPDTDTVDGIHPTQRYIDEVLSRRIADFIEEKAR